MTQESIPKSEKVKNALTVDASTVTMDLGLTANSLDENPSLPSLTADHNRQKKRKAPSVSVSSTSEKDLDEDKYKSRKFR